MKAVDPRGCAELTWIGRPQSIPLDLPAVIVRPDHDPLNLFGANQDLAVVVIEKRSDLRDVVAGHLKRLDLAIRTEEVHVPRDPRAAVPPAAFADRPFKELLLSVAHP